jgi:outer membrane lipoprotein-sorting protein
MRPARAAVLLTLCLSASPGFAQQIAPPPSPPRDARAVAAAQQALTAMGGTVPGDSVASGTVTVTAGSLTETGTVRILTRGTDQSVEEFTLPGSRKLLTFSKGLAAENYNAETTPTSLERAASSHSSLAPLFLLAAALNDSESAFEYVGEETVDGEKLVHVRVWKTFTSKAKLSHLAKFSEKDIWLEAATALPRRIAYEQRDGGGASDRFRIEVAFSDYRNVSGVLVPYHIEKSINGTPWASITIQQVTFNSGLTDSHFQVR